MIKKLAELKTEEMDKLSERLDLMFKHDTKENAYPRFDDACIMLGQINLTSDQKFETIGVNMGLPITAGSRKLLSFDGGEHYATNAIQVDNGDWAFNEKEVLKWRNPIYAILGVVQSYGKVVSSTREPTQVSVAINEILPTITVQYLGKDIEIVQTKQAKIIDSDGGNKLDTPKNRKHYGYFSWKGKAYKPELRGYHSGSGRQYANDNVRLADMRVGVEIEKEFKKGRDSLSSKYLSDRWGWVAETDSSLDSQTGYELVSPMYDLEKLSPMFKDLDQLQEWIDKKPISSRAGGHINVSCRKLANRGEDYHGKTILKKISGFICMLYAMYPDRAKNGYSEAKTLESYINSPSKKAFFPKGDRLEIRIFPEVSNVAELKLRLKLCRYMLKQSTTRTDVVIARMFNPKTQLHKLLKEMGYDVTELANHTMKFSADLESERFSVSTHAKLKGLGVSILTPIKRSSKEQSLVLKKVQQLLEDSGLSDVSSKLLSQLKKEL